ncbi:sensor histidine kinase [Marinitenerispora sediminis]|uniref:histidine kinase n=1 Tax=Marinitenerispora sediminis TaxID=1931232 RepID=A0A368T2D7_9ACTN|nr:histidine kinase [Marinitenerispora sediminis]RCV52113.1 two-component sensor histidine kinase [Marinitenerispora sediminis]RCV55530.1 two-component sensor histidine kinase [Marinitenerispora sediminis]RCV57834.1 two-component sensor histidine kinase [Marinitenerispora sediminis]
MTRRDRWTAGGVTAAAACVLAVAPCAPSGTVPAVAAVGVLSGVTATWPRSRAGLGWWAAAAGAVALAATAAHPQPAPVEAAAWRFAMAGALTLLLASAVRWAPSRRQVVAAVLLAGGAIAAWPLPFMPEASFLERVGACAFWSLPAAVAVVAGGYLRWGERRTRRAVDRARRAQRLELARDLHDFVAHDVSGIVVQAQAALFVAEGDPGRAASALRRIERSGLDALATLDRTVRMLNDPDGAHEARGADASGAGGGAGAPSLGPPPGLERLRDTVRRFGATGPARIRLTMADDAVRAASREAGTTAYRVVVEALTNVRRHAPAAADVRVSVARVRRSSGPALEVRVVNGPGDAAAPAPALPGAERDGGGRGLAGLGERVRAVGGTLSAGPCAAGWQVVAVLPCAGAADRTGAAS